MLVKIIVFFLFLFNAAHAGGTSEQDDFLADSDALVKKLAMSLQQELRAALQTGDIAGAVSTCHIQAPEITHELNAGDIHIKRTSLKWRNPENAPDQWERDALVNFIEQLDNGVAAKNLQQVAVIENEHGKTLRYIRPIMTKDLCLNCHGDKANMLDDVKAVLSEKYPDDLATGFSAGQLRGAFSMSRTISK